MQRKARQTSNLEKTFGFRNEDRCPDSQGQGWLECGGQVPEAAADWTPRLEGEGRTGKAAAGKEEGP